VWWWKLASLSLLRAPAVHYCYRQAADQKVAMCELAVASVCLVQVALLIFLYLLALRTLMVAVLASLLVTVVVLVSLARCDWAVVQDHLLPVVDLSRLKADRLREVLVAKCQSLVAEFCYLLQSRLQALAMSSCSPVPLTREVVQSTFHLEIL